MRLMNKRQDTRRMNKRFDQFNNMVTSILCHLLFFLLLGNVLLYMVG